MLHNFLWKFTNNTGVAERLSKSLLKIIPICIPKNHCVFEYNYMLYNRKGKMTCKINNVLPREFIDKLVLKLYVTFIRNYYMNIK